MNWASTWRRLTLSACLTGAAACAWANGGYIASRPLALMPVYQAAVVAVEAIVIWRLFEQRVLRSLWASLAANAASLVVGSMLAVAMLYLFDESLPRAVLLLTVPLSIAVELFVVARICRLDYEEGFIAAMIVMNLLTWGAGVLIYVEEPQPPRWKVPRAKADMKTVGSGIEAYFLDHGACPKPASFTTSPFWRSGNAAAQQAVRKGLGTLSPTLTTPIAYVTDLYPDPYAPIDGLPYAYHCDGQSWIVLSAGPDRVYDFDPESDFSSSETMPSKKLLFKTYDPTNGLESRGDVWKLKQRDRETTNSG